MTDTHADARPRTRPFPIVLSAPSGSGKTTVASGIFERFPEIRFAISMTTRERRSGEVDGVDYRFVSEAEFEAARSGGELAESAVVHGRLYGTPKIEIEAALAEGCHVLLDVDVQGGVSLMAAYPEAVTVFLLPPSFAAMEARLRGRGTDSSAAIDGRLAEALSEIGWVEHYEYVVVNADLEATIDTLSGIIAAEENRRSRKRDLAGWLDARFPQRNSAKRGATTVSGREPSTSGMSGRSQSESTEA